MQIKIPLALVRLWDNACDLLNAPLWVRGSIELRRVDALLVLGFIFSVGWYGATAGWQAAAAAAVMYAVMSALALIFRPG